MISLREVAWALYFHRRGFSRAKVEEAAKAMVQDAVGQRPDEVLAREATALAFEKRVPYHEAVAHLRETRPELWESYSAFIAHGTGAPAAR